MEANPNIVFLTADLGFNALEGIRDKFPGRFINVGIAEQHLIGMAAGLALEGKKVIAYSIASFSSMRPYEQIRTDVCYHNLDVKIIGAGGGVNYASHGITHHTLEDLAIMSVLPNMKILSPAYSWEATEATKALMQDSGPAYMRLGVSPGVDYSKPNFAFSLGKGYIVREGSDVVLFSTGNILDIVIAAAEKLEAASGMSVRVVSLPSVKPLDETLILESAKDAKAVFTIEEHSTIGGLGSLIAGLLWKRKVPSKIFHSFGFPDVYQKAVGGRPHLLKLVGIEAEALTKKMLEVIAEG